MLAMTRKNLITNVAKLARKKDRNVKNERCCKLASVVQIPTSRIASEKHNKVQPNFLTVQP